MKKISSQVTDKYPVNYVIVIPKTSGWSHSELVRWFSDSSLYPDRACAAHSCTCSMRGGCRHGESDSQLTHMLTLITAPPAKFEA